MQKINSKLPDFFYHSGPRRSVPSCPVKLVPDFNPSAGVPSYIEGDEDCNDQGQYFIPFFNEKSGPKHEDTTTNGHEARPGHHLQVSQLDPKLLCRNSKLKLKDCSRQLLLF